MGFRDVDGVIGKLDAVSAITRTEILEKETRAGSTLEVSQVEVRLNKLPQNPQLLQFTSVRRHKTVCWMITWVVTYPMVFPPVDFKMLQWTFELLELV